MAGHEADALQDPLFAFEPNLPQSPLPEFHILDSLNDPSRENSVGELLWDNTDLTVAQPPLVGETPDRCASPNNQSHVDLVGDNNLCLSQNAGHFFSHDGLIIYNVNSPAIPQIGNIAQYGSIDDGAASNQAGDFANTALVNHNVIFDPANTTAEKQPSLRDETSVQTSILNGTKMWEQTGDVNQMHDLALTGNYLQSGDFDINSALISANAQPSHSASHDAYHVGIGIKRSVDQVWDNPMQQPQNIQKMPRTDYDARQDLGHLHAYAPSDNVPAVCTSSSSLPPKELLRSQSYAIPTEQGDMGIQYFQKTVEQEESQCVEDGENRKGNDTILQERSASSGKAKLGSSSAVRREGETAPATIEFFPQMSTYVNEAEITPIALEEGEEDWGENPHASSDFTTAMESGMNDSSANNLADVQDSTEALGFPCRRRNDFEISTVLPQQFVPEVDISAGPSVEQSTSAESEVGNMTRIESEGRILAVGQFKGLGYKHIMVVNPLRCGFCNKPFVNQKSLAAHIVRSHPTEMNGGAVNANQVQCLFCNKKLQNNVNLRRHVRNVHKGKITDTCYICGAQFSSSHAFATHRRDVHRIPSESERRSVKRTRAGDQDLEGALKVFKCDTCGSFTGSKGNVERHIQIKHLKLRPFLCNCGKGFRTKNNLQCHMSAKSCDRKIGGRSE